MSDVYVKVLHVLPVGLRTEVVADGVRLDYRTDALGDEHLIGVEVLQARSVRVDGRPVWPLTYTVVRWEHDKP